MNRALISVVVFLSGCPSSTPTRDEGSTGGDVTGSDATGGDTTGSDATTQDPDSTSDTPDDTSTTMAVDDSTSDSTNGSGDADTDTTSGSTSESTGTPDPCADVTCDHGTCADGMCECDEGWNGRQCEVCDDGFVPIGGDCVAADSCAADPCGPTATCDDSMSPTTCTLDFAFTGAAQSWTVPTGVSSIHVTAYGAGGGCLLGGSGGEAIASVGVTPGEMLSVHVGGAGACGFAASLPGGFNGGGDKFTDSGDTWEGGSGGGATDLRRGGAALVNRVVVAGGGGGQGWGGQAGDGGGTEGETCNGIGGGCVDETCGGRGGTQLAGGIGGFCLSDCVGQPGSLGQGGTSDGCAAAGGGGGGGYYGGGGGAHCSGGGGSSRIDFPGNTAISTTAGLNAGDGSMTVVWTVP